MGVTTEGLGLGKPADVTSTRSRRRRLHRLRDLPIALTFLAPALVSALALRIWPVVRSASDAMHTTPLGLLPGEFVGFDQFSRLFSDPTFINSLKVTLLFSVIVNPLQIALALALALLFNEQIRGGGLMRVVIFLPVAVPQGVSAVIWGIALRPDGPVNSTLRALGGHAQPFLASPDQALASIILIVSWIGIGYWMTFLIAGLKDIPRTLYEAAHLDGANAWQRFVHITLPQLRRPLAFVLVADTVANFLVFAPTQILTRGGPEGRTDMIMNNTFERAFVSADSSGAAAATIVLIVVVLVIVVIQFRLLRSSEVS